MIATPPAPYPVQYDVDYPEQHSRWKALFRILLAIPALLFAYFVISVAYFALILMWLAVLVRGRIPRWLFDFQVGANRFMARTTAYVSLLTDEYPAFDGDYPVTYEVAYPDRISRRQLVIWKFAASLPQWIVVTLLQYAAYAIVAVGWLVILLTGKFPKGLHDFVVGVNRWRERVYAYSISLTDEYPPYSMSADAPAATGTARTVSSVIGGLAIAAGVAGLVLLIVLVPWTGEDRVSRVSYEELQRGDISFEEAHLRIGAVDLELLSALDPADEVIQLITPRPGYRMVLFSLVIANNGREGYWVNSGDFELNDSDDARDPILVVAGRRSPPLRLGEGDWAGVDVLFEVPDNEDPQRLSYGGGFLRDSAVYEFH